MELDMRILSKKQVEQLLPMNKAIALMEEAFAQLSAGKAQVPIRTHLHLSDVSAEALFMPVYLENLRQSGLKMVSINHKNPEKGMPLIQAMMLVMDAQHGRPLGLMDAASITAIRTGAATGLASKLLARDDAEILAIFGTGVQAPWQLKAVCEVRDIQEIWVFARQKEKTQSFIQEMSTQLGIPIYQAGSLDALVQADIICTATTSTQPLFEHIHLKSGVHINGIGTYRADMAEVPAETVAVSRLFVDQREACLKEAGDVIQAIDQGLIEASHIAGELGELVLGHLKGRLNEEEVTFFKSVGNAAQDLVCASYVLEMAMARGIGYRVPFH